jgi:hypothetical protein
MLFDIYNNMFNPFIKKNKVNTSILRSNSNEKMNTDVVFHFVQSAEPVNESLTNEISFPTFTFQPPQGYGFPSGGYQNLAPHRVQYSSTSMLSRTDLSATALADMKAYMYALTRER